MSLHFFIFTSLKFIQLAFLKVSNFFGILSPFPRCSSKQMQGASDAPLLSSLLLPLWAPLIEAAHLLNHLLLPLPAPLIEAAHLLNHLLLPLPAPLIDAAHLLKCLLLPLWAFSSATPLGFLFCYPFGISLLLDLPVSNGNWRKMKHEL